MSRQLQLTLDELLLEQVPFNKLPSLSEVSPSDMLLVVTALGLVGRATKEQIAPEVEPPPPPPIITPNRITFGNVLTIQWGRIEGFQGGHDGFFQFAPFEKAYSGPDPIAFCNIRESNVDRNNITCNCKGEYDKIFLSGKTPNTFLSNVTWEWIVIGSTIQAPTGPNRYG